MNWIPPSPPKIDSDLLDWAENKLLAQLLAQRGITTAQAARAFTNPNDYSPAPPTDLPDIPRAVELIRNAIQQRLPICVWGDFDVDGQTSTALLYSALKSLGATVCYYVPHRLTEGHGISVNSEKLIVKNEKRAAFDAWRKAVGSRRSAVSFQLSAFGGQRSAVSEPQSFTIHHSQFTIHHSSGLFISCDTGIEAHRAVDWLHSLGAQVIITDHHDLPETLPPAEAVINPKRLPPEHPLRELPGVGVAYKLIEALLAGGVGEQGSEEVEKNLTNTPPPPHPPTPLLPHSPALLDLVALGIVADVAAQTGDTRYLLQRGLETLRRTERPGLLALIEMANLKREQLTAEHIGFWLGPRLNALGRLGDANQGVELLTTPDKGRARILAAQLDALNERRKLLVDRTVAQALSQLADTPSLATYNAIVLAANNWHPGVIGIACSRLAEQFNKPVILLTLRDGLLRGSARSIAGCNIHQAIKTQAKLLESFGGHPMAAGLSMQFRHLGEFRQGVSAALEDCVSGAEPTLTIDAEVSLPELNLDLLNTLQKLAPFGAGNPPVTLAVKGLRVQRQALFGRARTHRKVTVADEAGNSAQVIWWNSSDLPLPEGTFDLALRISKDTWRRAQNALQLLWVDAREVGTPEKPAPRQIVDLRGQSDLQFLVDDPAALFWASDTLPGVKRLGLSDPNLTRGGKLVLWQAPPGDDLLRQIISAAQPQAIYLVARPSRLDALPAFMEHLMGVVKYALNRYGGRLQIAAIAAAMAHREGTVRLGLDWLVNRGKLRVIVKTEEVWVVRADNRPSRSDSNELQIALRELLRETAAYRAFVRSARIEALLLD